MEFENLFQIITNISMEIIYLKYSKWNYSLK